MGRHSTFHTLIANNRQELYDDYMNSTNADFCKKYKISGTTASLYFGGKKKPLYNGSSYWREEHAEMMERKRNGTYHYNLY